VPITHWCEAVRTWETRDLDALLRLEPLVALDRKTLETRYRFRQDQAIHVIAVRTWALAHPSTIAMTEAYAGCRSWVSLDEEIDIDGSRAVLTTDQLQLKIDDVAARLSWNSLAYS
jgi:hypothetical protein